MKRLLTRSEMKHPDWLCALALRHGKLQLRLPLCQPAGKQEQEWGRDRTWKVKNSFGDMKSVFSFPSGGVERRFLLKSAPAKTQYWSVSCRTIPLPTMVSVWNGWSRAVVVD